jgi:hypothetical protein
MKRLALHAGVAICLAGCAAAGIAACSGTSSVSSSPNPAPAVTAPPGSGSSAAPPAPTTPSGKDAAAVALSYYHTIASRDYERAFTYLAAGATGPDGRRLTLQAFLGLARTMDNEEGPVTHFSAAAFRSIVVMTVNRKEAGPYHTHLQLARAGRSLAIISIDRI